MVFTKQEVKGTLIIKSLNETLNSVSSGNKTELKVRCTGEIKSEDNEYSAAIESFVFKGDPKEMRELLKLLNLDTIDEQTTFSIDKNTQTRLDEEE